jgi:hypothetical protein
MITYLKKNQRNVFSMNPRDLSVFAELLWVLKHSPPPIGFNRKPLTAEQQRVVDDLFCLIDYPDGYAESLNIKTGQ